MEKGGIIYYPIKILLGFLIFTEILIWIGPWNFRLPEPFSLIFYLIIVNVALWYGYKSGVKHFRASSFKLNDRTIDFLIVFGLILNIYNLYSMWAYRGMSVTLYNLWNAIRNPGKAYYMESSDIVSSSSSLLILLTPISFSIIPFAICTWENRSRWMRLFVVLSIFITIAQWLGIGTRKGILDIIIIVAFCVIARNRQIIEEKKKRRKLRRIIVILVGLFLFYFIFSNISRQGQSNLSEALNEAGFYNYRDFYVKYFPPIVNLVMGSITAYLCQGYRALGLGLSMGIKPLAPFGMSWFTISIAKKLGFDPTPRTYLFALQDYGIDMSVNWHTAYLWLASDFTFIGVPIFIYIVGYFFAQSWCDSVNGKNILAFPVMCLFCIMVFYLFANNQVLSFSFVPMVVLFTLYQITRKLKNV